MEEKFLEVLEGRFYLETHSLNLNAQQRYVVNIYFKFMMDALCIKHSVEKDDISEFETLIVKLYCVNREFVEEQIKDRETLLKATHIIDVIYQLFMNN